jgi:hypothetical protein
MFGRKEKQRVTAVVLDVKPGGLVSTTTNSRGEVHRLSRNTYIIEVRPPGTTPFRVEAKAKANPSNPSPGDEVFVDWAGPGTTDVDIVIEGDPRYDWKLRRAARHANDDARRAALLAGLDAPPELTGDPEIDELIRLEGELGSRRTLGD